jgi:hypothetical protein
MGKKFHPATMAKKRGNGPMYSVPSTHGAFKNTAWLEYDAQFHMEMAASEDKAWTSRDSWQYITCLPDRAQLRTPSATQLIHVQARNQISSSSPPTMTQRRHWRARDHGAPRPQRQWVLTNFQQSVRKRRYMPAAYSTRLLQGAHTTKTSCSLIVVRLVNARGSWGM